MYKNITFSAEGRLIEQARRRAAEERKSLNELFRAWIARYVGVGGDARKYRWVMKHLAHVRPGRTFTRQEMNER